MVEPGKNDEQNKAHQNDGHDDFLRRLSLGRWPDLHAAFDQFGIVLQEIDADRRCRRHEHEAIQPSLPEAQRTRRREQQAGEGTSMDTSDLTHARRPSVFVLTAIVPP